MGVPFLSFFCTLDAMGFSTSRWRPSTSGITRARSGLLQLLECHRLVQRRRPCTCPTLRRVFRSCAVSDHV